VGRRPASVHPSAPQRRNDSSHHRQMELVATHTIRSLRIQAHKHNTHFNPAPLIAHFKSCWAIPSSIIIKENRGIPHVTSRILHKSCVVQKSLL
jgi:hypothetical protein